MERENAMLQSRLEAAEQRRAKHGGAAAEEQPVEDADAKVTVDE